ncbi:hypothetical protein GCM10023222_03190 [Saccharopolyspora cebuensis]
MVPLLGGAGGGTSAAFSLRAPFLMYSNYTASGRPREKAAENPRRCRLLGWGKAEAARAACLTVVPFRSCVQRFVFDVRVCWGVVARPGGCDVSEGHPCPSVLGKGAPHSWS